jgi:CDP-diglyceride synthetase
MTRVLSGLALAASAFGLVWFLPTSALIGVALVVAVLAFFEYARLVRAVGAPLPVTVSLLATLGACGLAAGVYPAAFGTTAVPAFGIALLA